MKTKILILIALLSIMAILTGFSVKNQKISQQIVLDFPVDNDDYEKDWKKVDNFINQGLPKSALKVVEIIYERAKKSNNAPQFIKATLFKMRLQSDFKEDFVEKIIMDLNEEIKTSDEPVTQILHSILAEIYWDYYQVNRYKFLNRTETINIKSNDIKTWDLKKIMQEIISNYMLSLKNSAELKKISLEKFNIIIKEEKNSKKYHPFLYDFLAHRAIDFFMNDESSLTQPVFKFELNKAEYFEPAQNFVKLKITTKDSLSLKFHVIEILQDLIAFHLNDKNPAALIDVDLKRLKFLSQNAYGIELKDSIFLNALSNLEKKYIDFRNSTDVSYEIAKQYFQKGQQYQTLVSDKYKWDKKKACEVCENAIRRFPESDGAKNCKILLNQIKETSLSLTTEYANIPYKPFLGLISYTNISGINLRIIKINPEKDRELKQNLKKENLIKEYIKLAPFKEWQVELINDGDFQNHSVEIKMPEIPLGYYVVLVGVDKNFSLKNSVAYSSFWISNISFISQRKTDGTIEFYILDRENGTLIKNVKAQTFIKNYNYNTRTYEFHKSNEYLIDKNGYFKIIKISDDKSFYVEFSHKNDTLITDNYFNLYHHFYRPEKKKLKTFFFTDRSIYRPGQTVYFKGIILEKNGEKYKIKPDYKTTLTFYDVNRQEVSKLTLVSNDYGSVNGTFTAPQGVLNGQMSIANESGKIYFSVEDYKRPKFEVTFNPVKGSYKLNEALTIIGNAKAYAGNAIDNAKVKYRVVRAVKYPYWGFWWRWIYPQSAEMEIKNGFITTDENGEFEIEFKAIPDLSIDKKFKPVFNYMVYADVTDINGETHSAEESIAVGYKTLLLNVDIPEKVNQNKQKEFKIISTNLNGEFVNTSGKISIYKLKQPDRIFRKRQWQRPDLFIINKEEFYKYFPDDIYDDDDNVSKWETEKMVSDILFDTGKDSTLKLNNIEDWMQGTYKLKISAKDKFGEEVENTNYFTVYSTEAKVIPDNSVNWFTMLKDKGEPGQNASFLIGTKAKNVNIIYEIQHNDTIKSRQWLKFNSQQKLIEIPIKDEYRGNFAINLVFVKNNRSYQNNAIIKVPYTNKELSLEFETFRNKLLPGQKEEWKIKIRGKKGEKVAAEMLATMYDASLDAFRENNWFFNIYKTYYSSLSWKTNNAFKTRSSRYYKTKSHDIKSYIFRNYDKLNWFGFNFYGRYNIRGMGAVADEDVFATTEMPEGELETRDIEAKKDFKKSTSETEIQGSEEQTQPVISSPKIQIRKNFNETAFFFPNLETNKDGDVIIKFTIPESLTKWKMMGLAYTKDLMIGKIQKELVTQKDQMVIPNPPRFFRVGDTITFSAKIVDLSDKELSGYAELHFFNALSMKPIDELLKNNNFGKPFYVKQGQSQVLNWTISIPGGIDAITYRITAKSGKFTDGEEMAIPVLTNRILVTESLPLPINGKETKHFKFIKLLNSSTSSTVSNYKLTLEFTSNPAWYAVQALPYLMEYPYECSEQIYSRYYANSIASHIANSNPKIKRIFESWKNLSPDALLSNLEKNQELKSVILEETPWVLNAKNESERKKRISLLFDLNKMSNELQNALFKLQQMQTSNGGWPWFKGMRDSRYITQHIVTGFGHLAHLEIKSCKSNKNSWNMIKKAVRYLDDRINEDYEKILNSFPEKINEDHLSNIQIQYLYARSFFRNDIEIEKKNEKAFNYFKAQADKYWVDKNNYMQGMIALALNRYGYKSTPSAIIKSLKEKALHSGEMGMYWRNPAGYFWYQAPVETQALLIEAFDEVTEDNIAVEEMKIWLLKQKQTQDWKTTKATAEAIYALILRGTDLLASDDLVNITIGNEKIDPKNIDGVNIEAGTGYFRTSWTGKEIKPDMGNITVTKNDEGIAWGAVYWQYFENLDKISSHKTPLSLEKKLFIEQNTPSGPVIEPVTENTILKPGDKIKVRIILRVDRNMEYVHMKDMRASAFEPVNVISGYKYQDGLGYYESTRDAATNFFFNYLNKGTYVFEYPLIVSQKGDFSNGITTIQCMYAPEFTNHSEGVRVRVGK